MNVDFDAPRPSDTDDADEPSFGTRSRATADDTPDLDGAAGPDSTDERDPIDEEMSVPVVPMRADEFRCGRCYLVHHRSRLADGHAGQLCRDCV
ncbi:DUF4193 family protein [Dactylosporangium matsuzakiense]|uniref:DUF4193 domain-containing protein n=1 Tax=Dactylosporangium matsuzakiense TaxID=53360 RepID=A0A9W6KRH1_9ACTN|nr:DUF4193 family protein [Dactylosporangium matsuzakiense]GLL05913.1 hypothetical protein GCM10017581_076610 [Dactylosporangium matsuzakiense]